MSLADVKALTPRRVSYCADLMRVVSGSLAQAVVLSQALYWQEESGEGVPWVQSPASWQVRVGLKRHTLARAMDALKKAGLLVVQNGSTRKTQWLVVDTDRLADLLSSDSPQIATNREQDAPNPEQTAPTAALSSDSPQSAPNRVQSAPTANLHVRSNLHQRSPQSAPNNITEKKEGLNTRGAHAHGNTHVRGATEPTTQSEAVDANLRKARFQSAEGASQAKRWLQRLDREQQDTGRGFFSTTRYQIRQTSRLLGPKLAELANQWPEEFQAAVDEMLAGPGGWRDFDPLRTLSNRIDYARRSRGRKSQRTEGVNVAPEDVDTW